MTDSDDSPVKPAKKKTIELDSSESEVDSDMPTKKAAPKKTATKKTAPKKAATKKAAAKKVMISLLKNNLGSSPKQL